MLPTFMTGGLATVGASGPVVTAGLPPLIAPASPITVFTSTGTKR